MFVRVAPPKDPVKLSLDGKAIVAARGEPIAVALLAAGIARIVRSPKLHRPRGPACLRGDCEGCIARVDGVPNLMTCMREARGGEEVSAQNALGSKDTDLLRVTDWFFPKGIDHHHLLAGIPGVSDVMQSFARRMAGIGRLPVDVVREKRASQTQCDVLVVGGGLSGAAAASAAAATGLDVCLVDEALQPGGSAAADPAALRTFEGLDLSKVTFHRRTSVVGVYRDQALLVSAPGEATVATARAFVFATGAHDPTVAVPNNDLPGVMSARALAFLAARGVVPKGRVALVGDGFWAKRVRATLTAQVAIEMPSARLASIQGRSTVTAVKDIDGVSTDVDVVAIAGAGAPSFELAASTGARVELGSAGYSIVTDASGRAGPAVFAVGECTGATFGIAVLAKRGTEVGRNVATALGAQPSISASKSPSPPAMKTAANKPSSKK